MTRKESEKIIEKRLRDKVKALGGLCLKMVTLHFSGLPDRIVLAPYGKVVFVETKSTKDRTSKIQNLVHTKLRKLGFTVLVIDSKKQVDELIETLK